MVATTSKLCKDSGHFIFSWLGLVHHPKGTTTRQRLPGSKNLNTPTCWLIQLAPPEDDDFFCFAHQEGDASFTLYLPPGYQCLAATAAPETLRFFGEKIQLWTCGLYGKEFLVTGAFKNRAKLGPTRYMFVLPGATVDGNQKSEINSPVELVKYPQNNIPYLQGFSHQNPPVFGLGISPKIPIGFWGLELCKRPWMEVDIVAMNSVMVTAGDRGTSDEVTPKNVVKSKGILPVDPWSFRFRNFHTQNYLCGNFEGIPL